ncbi:hypothetical protein E8E14_008362 [Neopestalotiopsis sp. 37M]|nr:hypothetical protein E8E14_008362 [Neopestalotiopsis sp. 37M]
MSSSASDNNSQPRRELFKGRLQKPTPSPVLHSYTTTPTGAHEITFKPASKRPVASDPVEIQALAVPQPFLDPSYLERQRREQKKV